MKLIRLEVVQRIVKRCACYVLRSFRKFTHICFAVSLNFKQIRATRWYSTIVVTQRITNESPSDLTWIHAVPRRRGTLSIIHLPWNVSVIKRVTSSRCKFTTARVTFVLRGITADSLRALLLFLSYAIPSFSIFSS